MNIINLVILFNTINITLASFLNSQWNNHKFRKTGLKLIIFKEKKIPKLLDLIKKQYKIYYDLTMVKISDGILEYDKLSYEDKEMIDYIISTILSQ